MSRERSPGSRSKSRWLGVLALCALGAGGCESGAQAEGPTGGAARIAAASKTPRSESAAKDAGPIRVEALDDTSPPVFVVRGRNRGPGRLVFLHGMCGHGLGYAQAFQFASARKGTLIAPQASLVCGEGPGAKWSLDVAAIDKRIVSAFEKLGDPGPIEDICVMGVSQGATRAAALARTYPDRYTRLVSIGAPTEVKSAGLERLRAAVLLVGERERKDLMIQSERALTKVGVPSRSLVIEDADHAGMGPHPERTMGTVLDWLWDNSRPRAEDP